MAERVRQFAVVAGATVGSRVLGLVRDMVAFAVLGTGLLNSAFLLAFTLPNLFRRLLGEGALTSALVPLLTRRWQEEGDGGFFALLEAVTWRVGLVLLGLVVAGSAVLALVPLLPGMSARWELGAGLGIVLLPYLLMVCLAAVFAAALNVRRRFGVAALSQVWLNLAQIGALALAAVGLASSDEGRVGWLCGGVLLGGLAQVLVPARALHLEGWAGGARWRDPGLAELWQLLLPGLAGAAILQINLAITRMLAFGVSEDAVSVLYLASRLVELPMGVFVVTVTTVRFPELAALAQSGDRAGAARCYRDAAGEIWTITLPAATGLVLLCTPILGVLFGRGRFGVTEVATTAAPLAIYALALPLYGAISLSTRGLHAFGDLRTPSRVAAVVFLVNTGLCLVLMRPFGVSGLAWANVASTVVHAILLERAWRRTVPEARQGSAWRGPLRLAAATAGMALLVGGGHLLLKGVLGAGRTTDWAAVALLVPLGAVAYPGILWAMGGEERARLATIVAAFRRHRARRNGQA